jgi:hypothetical protein
LSPRCPAGILTHRHVQALAGRADRRPDPAGAIVLLASWLIAFLTELMFRSVLLIFVQKTKTQLDDIIVAAIRRPLFLSVLFVGVQSAALLLGPTAWIVYFVHSLLVSWRSSCGPAP